jgi:hypothetical protein
MTLTASWRRAVTPLVAAALALALGAPTAASAREVFGAHGARVDAPFPPAFDYFGGPVLLTGGLAYLDLPGEHAHAMFRPTGGPSRIVKQFEPLLDRRRRRHLVANLQLAGDDRRLALGRLDEHPDGFPTSFAAVVTATLGGSVKTLADCPEGVSASPQVDGPVVEFLDFARSGCRDPLRERAYDVTTGEVFDIPSVDTDGTDPVIAGHYAIWSDQLYEHGQDVNRSVVYDFRAQRRIHATRRFELEAIGRDGTVVGAAFSVPGKPIDYECRDLVTYTVAKPVARALPYRTCLPFDTAIMGQRIVFLAPPPGRAEEGTRQRLMLGDTSGAPAVPLSESFASHLGEFDFDGERVAYLLYRCTGQRAYAVDEVATALTQGPIHIRPCRAVLDPPSNAVDVARGFDLGIECPRGCSGALWVKTGSSRWGLRAPHLFPLGPGGHTVHVDAPSAKPASAHKTEAATLEFVVRQPDRTTRTYTKPITIRRPG